MGQHLECVLCFSPREAYSLDKATSADPALVQGLLLIGGRGSKEKGVYVFSDSDLTSPTSGEFIHGDKQDIDEESSSPPGPPGRPWMSSIW